MDCIKMVVAMNPCKCGHLWDEKRICTCTGRQLDSHKRKLTGPLSDRIDMHIKVLPVDVEKIKFQDEGAGAMSSQEMKNQVEKARAVQRYRYKGTIYSDNGSLDEKGIREYCMLNKAGESILKKAYDNLNLSMRAYVKILKVSRTIADLEGVEHIGERHVAEALAYRVSYWDE
ncbi:MAG: ATP-binding protein [Clostridiales bacterium]|nr:ATP-binding protein [Clostridiales bacterium]